MLLGNQALYFILIIARGDEILKILFKTNRHGKPGLQLADRVKSGLGDGFKIGSAVLAQGADNVIREMFAFIDPTADLADISGLAFGFGLGLHVVLIIAVDFWFSKKQLSTSTTLCVFSS